MVDGAAAFSEIQHGSQCAGEILFCPMDSLRKVASQGQIGGDGAGEGAAGAVGIGVVDAPALEPV